MILPILGALERACPWLSYFHLENPVFHVPRFMAAAGVRRLLGEVPSLWRRFDPTNQPAIEEFLKTHGIDLVINLRNEDMKNDDRWSSFRARLEGSVEFWDLTEIGPRDGAEHITDRIVSLLRLKGLGISDVDNHFLRREFRPALPAGPVSVGLALGSQKAVKRWATSAWIELGRSLLQLPNLTLELVVDRDPEEVQNAHSVARALTTPGQDERLVLREGLALDDLATCLGRLSVLVANDSGLVHLATALDLPTVGMYFATDAQVWSGRASKFLAVQSQFFYQCPERKHEAGNCNRYDSGCPAPCKDEVGPQRVLRALSSVVAELSGAAG